MIYIKKNYRGEKQISLPLHCVSLAEAKNFVEELIEKGEMEKDKDILFISIHDESGKRRKVYYSQEHFPF